MTRLRDRLNESTTPPLERQPELDPDLDSFVLSPLLGARDEQLGTPVYDPETLERTGIAEQEIHLASAGLGSWLFFYKFGWKPTTDRQRAGLHAMKQALIDNGFDKGIDLTQQVFGNAATARTVEFQRFQGDLTDDGVIGPRTARRLFALYFDLAEARNDIPDHLLAKTGCGESNDDPIAEGILDPEDEGILQFHLPFWPGVTLAQALDPVYEILRGADKLVALHRATGSWKGAVAGWNIGGTYAKQWVAAGYPATGGPTMGTDATGKTIFAYERATAYWNYIDSLPYR